MSTRIAVLTTTIFAFAMLSGPSHAFVDAPPKSSTTCKALNKCDITVYVVATQPFDVTDSSGKKTTYQCRTFVDYETTRSVKKNNKIVWTIKTAQLGDTDAVYMFDGDSSNPAINFKNPKKLEKPDYDDNDLRQRYVWKIKNDPTKSESISYEIRVTRYMADGTTPIGPCEPNDPIIVNES